MAQNDRKVSDWDALEMVLKQFAGATLEAIGKSYGVSKQTAQYHTDKQAAHAFREAVINRAAEVAGNAIGQAIGDMMLEELEEIRNSGGKKSKERERQ